MSPDQSDIAGEPDSEHAIGDDAIARDIAAREIVLSRWQQLQRSGITVHSLQTFYAHHKYLVMSRDIDSYRHIGKLLATVTADQSPVVAQQAVDMIIAALQKPATRGGHANVLQHIRGYLKRVLSPGEKAELTQLIEQYRNGEISLHRPLELLQQHFRAHPDAYIEQQVFMHLYLDAQHDQI